MANIRFFQPPLISESVLHIAADNILEKFKKADLAGKQALLETVQNTNNFDYMDCIIKKVQLLVAQHENKLKLLQEFVSGFTANYNGMKINLLTILHQARCDISELSIEPPNRNLQSNLDEYIQLYNYDAQLKDFYHQLRLYLAEKVHETLLHLHSEPMSEHAQKMYV